MIKNYFKIAWRNLWKNKTFSTINIIGLAVGFTCCLLIGGFLYSELNYDTFPDGAKNIYRAEINLENKDFYSTVDVGVGPGMKAAFPEIESQARLINWGQKFVRYEDKEFKENSICAVDSNFLQLFSIPLQKGDVKTALNEPFSLVISKDMATKYFGNDDPVGKTLTINNSTNPFKVTGVLATMPGDLHFNFDIYVAMGNQLKVNTWSNVGIYTYLKLKPGTDPKKLEAKFPQLVAKNVVPEVQRDMGVSLAEAQKSINTFIFYLKPIQSIHLHSSNKDELQVNGSIKYIYIFAALAVFILLLAGVNFTNLSTATSIKRSKEVGIRKVMGSGKQQLIRQFLSESVLLTLFAFILSLGLVYLLLPYFNNLSGKHLFFVFFLKYTILLPALIGVFLVGVLAGIYPAFFLSSFNIISVLKGKNNAAPHSTNRLRSSLVVFQFAVSITLIICTMVVYKQLRYMQNAALGYDSSQAMIINDAYLLGKDQDAFKQQLLKDSRVENVTISRNVPVASNDIGGTQAFAKDNLDNESRSEIHIDKYFVDYDYLKTLNIPVKSGRFFSKDFSTDSFAVVLNETAVKAFGISGDPIGKSIITSGQHEYHIIGVVKDFHYMPLREKIGPLVMQLGNNYGGMIVKVKTADIGNLIAAIKSGWESFNAKGPFSYNFIDDRFASVYKSEERTGKIFSLFTFLSIIIASMGLFGLSAFATAQRTKEIGVRKVLGATVTQVVLLLSKEFVVMVMIAFIVAVPITWFIMNKWLQEFAYRIDIGWITFIAAGILALLLAFVTVSMQAIKAAIANPVKSLRTE
ncbi:MAG: ABC transporter permease [Bacteroidetes bacterium]|nr:ABC transporter permease [Bacteroidota bacterium]